MENAKTKKILKRILYVVLAILLALVLVFLTMAYLIPAIRVHQLEQLKMADSATANYSNLMSDTDEIYDWVTDLTAMGVRAPGTKAGKKAQTYVKDKFEEFGLEDVQIVKSKTDLWQCDDWGLTVGGEEIPSYYMRHTFDTGEYGDFSTPDGGLDTEIVYVGDGEESDFSGVDVKGKIVISDVRFTSIPITAAKAISSLFYDPNKTFSLTDTQANPYSANTYPYNYYNAMERGAVGFVGILTDYIDSNTYNNEDYSYLGGAMKLPGLWVTKNDGETIKKAIENAGGSAKVNMQMTGSVERVTAGAVVGFLPGNSDETLMVQSHYDSSTTGAVEDASGCSCVLALAKFYAQIPEEKRDRTLMFVEMDTHFSDYDSHDSIIKKFLGDGNKIMANVCIEHIANHVEEVDGKVELTGEVEPRIIFASPVKAMKQIAKEEVVRHGLDRTIILPASIFGDSVPTDADMYYELGVPIINLISGPIYLYDNIDTNDKVAKEELKPTTEAFADIIWRFMGLDSADFATK